MATGRRPGRDSPRSCLLVETLPLANYLRTIERDRLVTRLEREAFTIAGASTRGARVRQRPSASAALTSTVEAYGSASGATVVVVDAARERSIAASQPAGRRPRLLRPGTARDPPGARRPGRLRRARVAEAGRAARLRRGAGALRHEHPRRRAPDLSAGRVRRRRSTSACAGCWLAAAITLAAAAVIAVLVAGGVTRRVRRLRDAAERIAEGDLTARAEVSGGGEIEELAEAVQHDGRARGGRGGVAARVRR